MKRKILSAAAAIALALGAQAQVVNIVKGGTVIASYPISEIDEVVFAPAAAEKTPAEAVAGTYAAAREVTLPQMAQMGVLVSDNVDVTVTATADDKVTVALPSCQYNMMGTLYDLPAATVENVAVTKDGDKYALSGTFEGTVDGKATTVTLSGTVNADGSFFFSEDMKYGSMPFTLHMEYKN